MQNFNILLSRGDWFESRFVGNPKDTFSHVTAQIIPILIFVC